MSKRIHRDWVLHNLRETVEHIEALIQEIETGNEGLFCESYVAAVYRDLNRAWNGRFLPSIRAGVSDESLCRFPTDIDVAD
jgi:hypothetical protein